jgi:hypothetical protein
MRRLSGSVVLVLDDVHVLAGSEVMPGLALLLHNAPAALRLILSGRSLPELHVARMRVAGTLSEVMPADLACTAEEAEGYFAALGLTASAAERDQLLGSVEGWMAGPAARRAHRGAGRGAERRRHRRRPHRRRLPARRGAGPAAPRGPAVPPAHQRGRAADRGLRRLADGRARRNAHPGPAQQDGQLRVQGRAGQVPVSPVPAAGAARRAARGHARGGSRPVRPGRALAHARRRRDRSSPLLGRDRGLGARVAGADRGGAGRGAARPDRGAGDGPRAVSRGAPRRRPRGGGGAQHGAAVPR